jgi:CheY-like chemotaxis protein
MNRNHSNVAEVDSIQSQTAMLVDDDANYRQVPGEALTEGGWDVIEAATGENALLLDVKPALLVAHVRLGPGMDGWSLGGLARNRRPDVGLLFISKENQPDRQQHFSFLQRPHPSARYHRRGFRGGSHGCCWQHRYASAGNNVPADGVVESGIGP